MGEVAERQETGVGHCTRGTMIARVDRSINIITDKKQRRLPEIDVIVGKWDLRASLCRSGAQIDVCLFGMPVPGALCAQKFMAEGRHFLSETLAMAIYIRYSGKCTSSGDPHIHTLLHTHTQQKHTK